jgi:vancomycin permeability regulator SanA
VAGAIVVLSAVPFVWTRIVAAGHLYDAGGADGVPAARVVLVLGAELAPGGTQPKPVLAGRLDTAARLVREGRAEVILVSGDGGGVSGDETAAMRGYLTGRGIEPGRVVADPHGLDTYDSCWRARHVYGIERALVVTQSYHLARAVALCRSVGVDADGVRAACDDCRSFTLFRNGVRDYVAASKAALDAARHRRAAVESPPDDAVNRALPPA